MRQYDTTRWRDLAACRAVDPEWFFPTSEQGSALYDAEVSRAKAVCGPCPVRAACLRAAAGEPWGISGGLTEHERRALHQGAAATVAIGDAA